MRMRSVNEDLPEAIIGQTPDLEHMVRADEIDKWLQDHPEVTQFIVIDDLGDQDLERFGNSFIQTYFSDGLTEELKEQCIARLQ